VRRQLPQSSGYATSAYRRMQPQSGDYRLTACFAKQHDVSQVNTLRSSELGQGGKETLKQTCAGQREMAMTRRKLYSVRAVGSWADCGGMALLNYLSVTLEACVWRGF